MISKYKQSDWFSRFLVMLSQQAKISASGQTLILSQTLILPSGKETTVYAAAVVIAATIAVVLFLIWVFAC